MGLGSLDDVTLAQARQMLDKWLTVFQVGRDPISERDRIRAEEKAQIEKQDPTLSEMTKIVFEAKKSGMRGDGTRGRWMSAPEVHVLPKIGHMPISEIHQANIQRCFAAIWRSKHPTAIKAIRRLSIIFKQAKLSGIDADPFTVEAAKHLAGDVRHVAKLITATRWQDIPDLYQRLRGSRASSHMALRLAILTAARSMSVRGATFDEFDGDIWTAPADRMKGREGQVSGFRIPLSQEALRLVAICEEYKVSEYLFPSNHAGKFISDHALHKALTEMKEPGRPHGFRTSFRTCVQDTDAAHFDVAETALAHIVGNKVERAYARSDLLDQRRVLMQKWADHVTGTEAKVVKIRR